MTSDRPKFFVHVNSTVPAVSPIVPKCTEDAGLAPFAVPRHDRRTKERIFAPSDEAILDLIKTAYNDLAASPGLSLTGMPQFYARRLVESGLDRRRARRVMTVVQRAAKSSIGWTDWTSTEITKILRNRPPPIRKSSQLLRVLPLENVQREFAKLGLDTRVLIEGSNRTLVLFDYLHGEMVRIPIREGDKVQVMDVVTAFQEAEMQRESDG